MNIANRLFAQKSYQFREAFISLVKKNFGGGFEPIDFAADLDPEARLELLLAGFPPHWAERYAATSPRVKEAFLFSHEGATAEALTCLDDVEPGDRNDLYYFERGSLLARSGETDAAFADLELAVTINPDLEFAWEAWVDLELATGAEDQARQRLAAMLDSGNAVAFCHARLAALEAQAGDAESALHHGLSAVRQGDSSPATVSLCAVLLERAGRDAEAETYEARVAALSPSSTAPRRSASRSGSS